MIMTHGLQPGGVLCQTATSKLLWELHHAAIYLHLTHKLQDISQDTTESDDSDFMPLDIIPRTNVQVKQEITPTAIAVVRKAASPPMVLEPIPPLMEWRRGSPLDISQWRTEIRGYVRDNTTSISLTGPSVEALNLAIFSAIRHQEFGTPFVLPSEVVCGESAAAPSDLQYFAPGATYSM
jgi:hypothetical protein